MVRVHLLQISLNLSDPQMESLLHSDYYASSFCRFSFACPAVSDTTVLRFRHFLEKHGIAQLLLDDAVQSAATEGAADMEATAGDATYIEAPSSTKNSTHARNPEMASGKKANTWHFGMKH